MLDAFKSLPKDPDELRSVSAQMLQHIQSQAYQIEKLKAELHGHRKARFGSKSESMDQLALDLLEDDEIAQAAEDHHTEQPPGDEGGPTNKRQHSRKPLPDHRIGTMRFCRRARHATTAGVLCAKWART
ncbi:transposase [Pseudosulfitobacter pseudonitzschiae]|uniref:transposase n=1 Tax=Pseudosulfitobacter pseudonitzschiae TaxID=1402135 RepID=UPI001E2BEC00|nr:transposase [Pseudosulfitobacter pseudonitzschiae]UFE67476.1 transposase [Pseudosulfitobacter pseudonitzschiae]UFF49420.1 transposase [Pseudosulfitobacter pseudonitzschiae]UFF50960.1 transposase [Pseudosulfitobacter pseudonitzschiae]UFF51986.1 transposase [Pseudosulfitobacter pseudonitzschiae]